MPTVAQYRREVNELVRLASIDLDVLWRQAATATIARDLLMDVLPELTGMYGSAAGTLAADWYDDLRAEEDINGRFQALVADLPSAEQTDALARWSVTPLFDATPDFAGSLLAAQGGLQRLISNVGRDTITISSIADPGATGWQRSASGGCNFCQMLAGRGAVYSKTTVDFGAHDNCNCTAVPAFSGKPIPVKPHTPTSRTITDADRQRTREWMRKNGY